MSAMEFRIMGQANYLFSRSGSKNYVRAHSWANMPGVPPSSFGYARMCAPSFFSRQRRHLDSIKPLSILLSASYMCESNLRQNVGLDARIDAYQPSAN